MTTHRIIIGDSRRMREVEDRSVHLVVTSPPYWQIKDYGGPGQIGYNDTYEEYVNHLSLVWQECSRVLHDGCRLCINIGDQFARGEHYGRYKVIPIRTEVIKFCEALGLDYMGAVIWQKVTTCNTSGGGVVMGSFPCPRNGILKLDYEFILIFKKPGTAPVPTPEQKKSSRLTREEWNEYFYGHWNFSGSRQNRHLAAFPEELPRRLIKMFSFRGETVLDPFLGSGTTSLAAKNLGRSSVGYEANPDFLAVIKGHLGLDAPGLFDRDKVEVVRQERERVDYERAIDNFPYRFRDPHNLKRTGDPKKRTFGSRIDGKEREAVEYQRVSEVAAPDQVTLGNGVRVRLIGIRPVRDKFREAVEFLRERTRGQRVFYETEAVPCPPGEVPCYLFLKNKTCLNARLIRSGLVEVETAIEYRRKRAFLDKVSRTDGERR
jgi:DNA modification methylase